MNVPVRKTNAARNTARNVLWRTGDKRHRTRSQRSGVGGMRRTRSCAARLEPVQQRAWNTACARRKTAENTADDAGTADMMRKIQRIVITMPDAGACAEFDCGKRSAYSDDQKLKQ